MKQYLCVFQRNYQNFYQTFIAENDAQIYRYCAQQSDIDHVLFVTSAQPVDDAVDARSISSKPPLQLSEAVCVLRRPADDEVFKA